MFKQRLAANGHMVTITVRNNDSFFKYHIKLQFQFYMKSTYI